MSSGAVPELTEAQMMAMSLADLQAYADKVNATVAAETSTITGLQKVQDVYDRQILQANSTITGLDTEITTNTSFLANATQTKVRLDAEAVQLDSTISQYISTISGLDTEISAADTLVSSLTLESAQIDKDLAASDAIFVSSAIGYSTLYIDYLTKETTYQQRVADILATSSLLSSAIVTEMLSAQNLAVSSATRQLKEQELSTLYLNSNAIQSTLSRYITDETNAQNALNSTMTGINTLSSLYETALVTQKYYQAVSTQSAKIEQYAAALSTFNEADRLATTYPTNTVYTSAKSMATSALEKANAEKKAATDSVTALQQFVANAQTDSYDALLSQYTSTIRAETDSAALFRQRRTTAETEVKRYSTLYDQAVFDVASSIQGVMFWSTLYESSLTGSATLSRLAQSTYTGIAVQQGQVDTLNILIASLCNDYANFNSSYQGFMAVSTQKKAEFDKAVQDIALFSSFYESTNMAVLRMNTELGQVMSTIAGTDTILRVQSTIVEREAINILDFDWQLKASINTQEKAAYQYRETYARQKRMAAQLAYEARVTQAVQNTSTQNGFNKSLAPAGTTFVPIPVDLNATELKTALGTVTTIQSFLDSFQAIYTNYDIQATNFQNVSTAVSNRRSALNTLLGLRDLALTSPGDATIPPRVATANDAFNATAAPILQNNQNVDLTQGQITAAKLAFNASYMTIFRSDEIIAAESTISSFLVQGFKTAVVI